MFTHFGLEAALSARIWNWVAVALEPPQKVIGSVRS